MTHRERGATSVEYGLFVALVAAVIITAVSTLGSNAAELFTPVTAFFAGLGH